MYRLLIADDEAIERGVLYKRLRQNLGDRCVIFQAENGREALEIYEREKIQIAILDIEMPGINGIEAAKKIRETDKECCLIFLTAFDNFSYARTAVSVRALDYLLKPCDEQELMLVLEEAMHLADKAETEKSPEEDSTINLSEDTEEAGNIRMSNVAEVLLKYIRENYKHDISMQATARIMNYSEPYFCKLFKQCFDQNFTSYLTQYRVNEAKKLLEDPMVNIKDIGIAVGYGDSNYFTKVFRRITGQSPSEYRLCIFQKK